LWGGGAGGDSSKIVPPARGPPGASPLRTAARLESRVPPGNAELHGGWQRPIQPQTPSPRPPLPDRHPPLVRRPDPRLHTTRFHTIDPKRARFRSFSGRPAPNAQTSRRPGSSSGVIAILLLFRWFQRTPLASPRDAPSNDPLCSTIPPELAHAPPPPAKTAQSAATGPIHRQH